MLARIVLVEDDLILAKCIAEELRLVQSEFQLVGSYDTGAQFLRALETLSPLPDVVLMDLQLPGADGILTTEKALAAYPRLKIIAHTGHVDEQRIVRAFRAGVRGFLSKHGPRSEVFEALRLVYRGGCFISPQVHGAVADYIFKREGFVASLSPGEQDVLRLLEEGLTQKAIASHLGVSTRMVEKHLESARRKLFAASSLQACAVRKSTPY